VLLFFPSFGASSRDQRIPMEGAVRHKFITQADLHPNDMDFGRLSVLSHPSTTGTKHPTILAVSVLPSKGHDFRWFRRKPFVSEFQLLLSRFSDGG
jgi:hypothetical protein